MRFVTLTCISVSILLQVLPAITQGRAERQARKICRLLPHLLLFKWARDGSARLKLCLRTKRKHAEVHRPSLQRGGGEACGSSSFLRAAACKWWNKHQLQGLTKLTFADQDER